MTLVGVTIKIIGFSTIPGNPRSDSFSLTVAAHDGDRVTAMNIERKNIIII